MVINVLILNLEHGALICNYCYLLDIRRLALMV